jgi:EmrB/QacA subfamily drug resistance transporter
MTESHPISPTRFSLHDKIVLWLACVAQFMVILDVSIVNVALPSIGHSLHYSASGLQWVVNAYILAFAGFLLLGGRAADIFGRRRIFILGTVLFSLASLVGGLATTSGMLTSARVAQGLGAAFLSPATLTIIVTSFSGPRLPKALGAWGAVGGAGGAVGALAGGILTAELSWRWVLFINVPIGILVVVVALSSLTELSHRTPESKLDVAGALLVTAGLSALVYAIVGTSTHPWGSSTTIGWLAASVALLLGFAVVETIFASSPIVPFSFLKNRITTVTSVIMFLIGATFFGMWYFLTLYYQEVLGWSALRTGLAFVPQTIAIIIGAQVASRLLAKLGAWPLIIAGTAAATLGFYGLAHLKPTSSYFGFIVWPAILTTLGLGVLSSPLAAAATSHVGHQQAGLASGLLNSSRQIGGSLGLAVLATVAVNASKSLLPGFDPNFEGLPTLAEKAALAHGYNVAFLWGAVISLLSLATTFLLPRDVARAPRPAPIVEPAA